MLMTHVVPARRQIQIETRRGRVLTAAGLGADSIATVTGLLIGCQAHRRLRRVHGSRANKRALHPAQLHAPFRVAGTNAIERLGLRVIGQPSRRHYST